MLHQELPEYSNYMYLQGFSPYEILESHRRTSRKKHNKKKEQSIFEKEMLSFVQNMLSALVDKSLKEMFKDWK